MNNFKPLTNEHEHDYQNLNEHELIDPNTLESWGGLI